MRKEKKGRVWSLFERLLVWIDRGRNSEVQETRTRNCVFLQILKKEKDEEGLGERQHIYIYLSIYLSTYLVCNNAGIAGVVGGANTTGLHTGVVVGAGVLVADQDHRDVRTEVAIRGEHREHAEGGDVSGAIRLLLG